MNNTNEKPLPKRPLDWADIVTYTGACPSDVEKNIGDAQLSVLKDIVLQKLGVKIADVGVVSLGKAKLRLMNAYFVQAAQEEAQSTPSQKLGAPVLSKEQKEHAAMDKVNEFIKKTKTHLEENFAFPQNPPVETNTHTWDMVMSIAGSHPQQLANAQEDIVKTLAMKHLGVKVQEFGLFSLGTEQGKLTEANYSQNNEDFSAARQKTMEFIKAASAHLEGLLQLPDQHGQRPGRR